MRWGILVMVVATIVGCAHSKPAECRAEGAPATGETLAVPADAVLNKFDPALRWSLRDKTSPEISALAELSAPLSQAERERLQQSGLRILSADNARLHVRGDAQALLYLATYPQVTRIQPSRQMRPKTKE